jgi:Mn-dependent DtxR family transcriptional regulator
MMHNPMKNEEIKEIILRRLYDGAFKRDVEYELNLNEFADKKRIDRGLIWKIYDELKENDLIRMWAMGGWVAPTSKGILYCEQNKLVDDAIIRDQNKIRVKILKAYADIYEKHSSDYLVDWEEICKIGDINRQDFQNNIKILIDGGYIEKNTIRAYSITLKGLETMKEYRRKTARLEKFEKLENLIDTTPQMRGHELEDVLAEVAEDEGWQVIKRARSQGQEHDIIIHQGFHYLLISCKWEKDPLQPEDAELLESRVRSRANTTGGILFSMSGFTDNCIEEARLKISSARIMLFGQSDIKTILSNEKSLTKLIEDKLEQIMHHRIILIDGEAN